MRRRRPRPRPRNPRRTTTARPRAIAVPALEVAFPFPPNPSRTGWAGLREAEPSLARQRRRAGGAGGTGRKTGTDDGAVVRRSRDAGQAAAAGTREACVCAWHGRAGRGTHRRADAAIGALNAERVERALRRKATVSGRVARARRQRRARLLTVADVAGLSLAAQPGHTGPVAGGLRVAGRIIGAAAGCDSFGEARSAVVVEADGLPGWWHLAGIEGIETGGGSCRAGAGLKADVADAGLLKQRVSVEAAEGWRTAHRHQARDLLTG